MLLKTNGCQDLKSTWDNRNPINEHNLWSFQNLTPKRTLTQVLKPQRPSSRASSWSHCRMQPRGHAEPHGGLQ